MNGKKEIQFPSKTNIADTMEVLRALAFKLLIVLSQTVALKHWFSGDLPLI